MKSSSIRLVCFDLGGVLIRICRSWHEVCQAAEIDVRVNCREGQPDIAGWHELCAQLDAGQIDTAGWAFLISKATCGAYTPEEIHTIHHSVLLHEFDGVGKIIDRIHEAGFPTAALSNTNGEHWRRMDEFPAVMRLRHRLASHELGLCKPDPAIYRALENQLQYRGGEILFFDDRPENIKAAQDLGWIAYLIDPLGQPDQQIESALEECSVLSRLQPQSFS